MPTAWAGSSTSRPFDFCRGLLNTREIVVPGIHYIQEDSPGEIGQAVADLVRELDGG